uniref:Nucleoside-diphosphate kinase n=1 Tax=Oncorhynchus tshawytscha TaxID=74940 RepID=A0AAZ3NYX4_ONCTS
MLLFLLTGLMYYKPEDPIDYLEVCLKKVRELGGPDRVRWDTFVGQEKKSLPPLNGGQSRRSFFRNVLPDSPNFPYRRYDRLPPISQFSIESDSDLSETAELIEEYEVFDPSRPRPKVILIIGGPGSGKGTQSLKIAACYGFQYVSVGELLRKKMIHNATSNRKWSLIAKIITNGELAPQETTITEIKQKIMKIPDASGIVIDGFPRDVGQALSFEDQICTPDLVVFLSCANHRLKERLEKRAEATGRPDDNPNATERRLTNFKQNTIPLVKYFQERGLIVTVRQGCVTTTPSAPLPHRHHYPISTTTPSAPSAPLPPQHHYTLSTTTPSAPLPPQHHYPLSTPTPTAPLPLSTHTPSAPLPPQHPYPSAPLPPQHHYPLSTTTPQHPQHPYPSAPLPPQHPQHHYPLRTLSTTTPSAPPQHPYPPLSTTTPSAPLPLSITTPSTTQHPQHPYPLSTTTPSAPLPPQHPYPLSTTTPSAPLPPQHPQHPYPLSTTTPSAPLPPQHPQHHYPLSTPTPQHHYPSAPLPPQHPQHPYPLYPLSTTTPSAPLPPQHPQHPYPLSTTTPSAPPPPRHPYPLRTPTPSAPLPPRHHYP